MLCGTTLIVPDLDRVFALDYRSGRLLWELPEKDGLLLDGVLGGPTALTPGEVEEAIGRLLACC